jgi:hypothetical protein
MLLLIPTISFADVEGCQSKLDISQTSVEYLVNQRNVLESSLIVANTNLKRMQLLLDAANKVIESSKEKDEKPEEPKKK